jgi:hypothetical protein
VAYIQLPGFGWLFGPLPMNSSLHARLSLLPAPGELEELIGSDTEAQEVIAR